MIIRFCHLCLSSQQTQSTEEHLYLQEVPLHAYAVHWASCIARCATPTAGHRSSTALHKVQPCSLSLGYECAQASSDVAAASWHRHSSPRYCCCHCLHMLYNTEKRKVYAYQQSLQRPQIKPQAAPCAQWSYMRGCLPYPAAQCKHGTLSLHLLGSHHAVMSLHPGDQLVGACSCQVMCNVAKLDFLLAWHPSTYMAS